MILIGKNSVYVLILISSFFLLSCGGESVFFEKNRAIADKSWNVVDKQDFEFEVTDTSKHYDFFFNVRTTSNYEYSNLYVFYKLYFPNGKSLTDTAQFVLADPTGRWLGKSVSGSLIDNSILFSKNRSFPLVGKYTFSVVHGMRNKSLPEISDVGFKIKETRAKDRRK
jgi:gliding motility-associated lipoprotein GldH